MSNFFYSSDKFVIALIHCLLFRSRRLTYCRRYFVCQCRVAIDTGMYWLYWEKIVHRKMYWEEARFSSVLGNMLEFFWPFKTFQRCKIQKIFLPWYKLQRPLLIENLIFLCTGMFWIWYFHICAWILKKICWQPCSDRSRRHPITKRIKLIFLAFFGYFFQIRPSSCWI